MHELELELQIPAEERAVLEAALDVAHWDRTELEAHYFDTAGGQLAAHGFSWRLRRARVMERGASRVEVAYDHGSIHAQEQRVEVCEPELELREGLSDGVFALARPWLTAHRLWPSTAFSRLGEVRDGERFTELPVEHQHRVRKRLKRLRYLSEFLAPLYGAHAVERYVEALRPAPGRA